MEIRIEINRLPDVQLELRLQETLSLVGTRHIAHWGLRIDQVQIEIAFVPNTQSIPMLVLINSAELSYPVSLASEVWYASKKQVQEQFLEEAAILNQLNALEDESQLISFYGIMLEEVMKHNIEHFLSEDTLPVVTGDTERTFKVQDRERLIEVCKIMLQHGWSLQTKMPPALFELHNNSALTVDELSEKLMNLDAPFCAIIVSEKYLKSITLHLKSGSGDFAKVDENLFYRLGIDFPDPKIVMDDSLGEYEFRIQVNDWHSMIYAGLRPDQYMGQLLLPVATNNAQQNSVVHPVENQRHQLISSSVPSDDENAVSALGYVLLYLARHLHDHADAFITIAFTGGYMSRVAKTFPDLVKAVKAKRSAEFITQVLRALVRERISLRNFDTILQSLLDFDFIPLDASSLIVFDDRVTGQISFEDAAANEAAYTAEYARMQLKMYISYQLTRGNNTLVVHLLSPEIEKLLLKEMTKSERAAILESVALEANPAFFMGGRYNPILTTVDVRMKFRQLCEKRFPTLPVIGYQELSPETNIQPVSRISLN